jgi:diguanylate cyclase (GGDEF)-like protein
VSLILSSIVTALGGMLAGFGMAGALLWRQHQALIDARTQAARAHHLATHDDTTGLPNRRALLGRLHALLRDDAPLGVVLLDLDGFKTVNDTLGHETGNDLLTEVGRRLSTLEYPVVLAARLSGDEYALLVAGGHDQVALAARAAWRAVAAAPVPIGTDQVSVRVSVGYACRTLGVTPRGLLRDADEAMYRAKTTGSRVYGAATTNSHSDTTAVPRYRDRRH